MERTPVRILHMIASLELGGSQTFVMNIYRHIDRKQIQFDFIIDHTIDMYFQKEIESLGGKIYVMPTFKGYNISEIRKAWNEFFAGHSEYKILHSHSRSYAFLYLPIAKRHGLKTIIHSHSTSNGGGVSSIAKCILQYPLRFQADYFMACSKEAGEWLFGKKICQGGRYQIIKNSINAKSLVFDENTRREARRELGLKNEFVLGFLARVVPPKNPMFVIDVFSKLKEIKRDTKLLFVGDGEMLSEVKAHANDLGLGNDVIFTGARADIEKMFFAMDCYILPSLWEGLGISLIEAQASGLNCICSDNIQSEAIIVSELVVQKQLSEGAESWAKAVCSMEYEMRSDCYLRIKKAGYEVSSNIEGISHFYLLLSGEYFEEDNIQ